MKGDPGRTLGRGTTSQSLKLWVPPGSRDQDSRVAERRTKQEEVGSIRKLGQG